jgi:hypothetical protein
VVDTFVVTADVAALALGPHRSDPTKRSHIAWLRGRLGRDLDPNFTCAEVLPPVVLTS